MAAQRWALVTGGNRGLGLEVCKQLVAAKKPVLLTSRDLAAGQAVATQLATPDTPVKALQLDAASSSSIASLAAAVKAEYDGQIDLLVNNAGILFRGTWDAEAFNATLATNTTGPIDLSRALAPHLAPSSLIIMVSSGLGALANLSPDYSSKVQAAASLDACKVVAFDPDSPMGNGGAPNSGSMTPTYSVAKALLNRAVQLMAAEPEFASRGINVVSTCPGWCRTDMGGGDAHRSAEQGAASILWPFTHWSADLAASFTRDGEKQAW